MKTASVTALPMPSQPPAGPRRRNTIRIRNIREIDASHKRRLMIVDDSAMMRLVIENTLRDDPNLKLAGTAANGREAIERLPTVKPDLILLDIEMPEMDGIEFLRCARPRAKVIVLSSAVQRTDEAIAAGADAVISKPSGAVSYDIKERRGTELHQTIYRLLGLRAG
jgi:two-component system, chemotaxis family, protein-glutamate methylesterase/glutaminase